MAQQPWGGGRELKHIFFICPLMVQSLPWYLRVTQERKKCISGLRGLGQEVWRCGPSFQIHVILFHGGGQIHDRSFSSLGQLPQPPHLFLLRPPPLGSPSPAPGPTLVRAGGMLSGMRGSKTSFVSCICLSLDGANRRKLSLSLTRLLFPTGKQLQTQKRP